MSNMIKIYSSSGTLITEAPCAKDCMRRFSLMQEDCVVVKFSHRDSMRFPIGSRITVGTDDFLITKQQQGKRNEATGVWSYELTFEAYYRAWANKILRYIIPGTDSPRETSFTLTATIDVHAAMLKNCLDFLGMKYDGSPFRIDTDESVRSAEAKLVRYENLSVLGGIQAIAEAFECEWWVEGNAVCFGRLERERTDLRFEAGVNVSTISFADGKSVAPNRLYVFGSDRNLPPNYRPTDSGDTIGGVVARRLMLPEGTPYLQTSPDIPESEVVEAVVVFDDVYPRTGLTVDGDPGVYEAEAEQGDGTMAKESFYRLRYGSGFRFSSAYLLSDEELHIVFRSGLLNGMDFGARFNPKGFAEKNADGSWNDEAQMIEVVANEDYGRKLPDTILRPQKGDEFILYGWDATKMADLGLIADAEAELLEEGKKALKEYAKDLSSCTCPMAWDYMKPLFMDAREPRPGDQVTIIDTAHFGGEGRKSRIIGYEYPLDKPYAGCTYTCGEAISERRLDSIEQKIEGLAQSGRKVQIQNSLDFLSKRYADRTPYKLSSDTAFEVGKFVAGVSGGIFGIDKASGKSFGEMDELFVRCKAYFESLTVIEAETLAGRNYITPGGSVKCVAVRDSSGAVKHPAVVAVNAQGNELDDVNDPQAVAYRCFYLEEQAGEKTLTKIMAGDQAISRTFNAQAGSQGQVTNHYWWRLVTAVQNAAYTDPDTGNVYGYIEVSRADCDKPANQNEPNGSGGWLACDIPADGDVIAHLGNRNDLSRQTAIILDTVGVDAPSIKLFGGIDSFSLAGRDIVSFGYDSVTGRAYFRSYGSMLIGDREKNGAYAEFDERNKDLVIKGRIVASSPVVDDDGDDTGKTVSDLLNGVTDSRIYFIGHTSATSAPALPSSISDLNGWSAAAPAWQQGRYVWQTTYIVKADGSESFSPAVCLSGAKGDQGTPGTPGDPGKDGTPGADGKDGKDGTPGADGNGIVRIATEYYLSTSSTTPTGGSWSENRPAQWIYGQFLWTRSHVYYTDGSDATYGEVCTEEFDYIKQSLKQAKNGVSITDGGLFLSSMIKLGIWDKTNPASPVQTEVRAGMNGIYDTHAHGGGIATWWGGDMVDLFKAGTNGLSVRKTAAELGDYASKAARALVRMNGSAYFSNGNVGFEYDGSAWLGNENGLRVDKLGNITMGNGVTINISNVSGLKSSLQSLTNFNIGVTRLLTPYGVTDDGSMDEISWEEAFEPDPTDPTNPAKIRAKSLKAKVGLWSNEFISARGQDDQSGGGGGSLFGLYSKWALTPSATDALSAVLGKELYTKFDDYYTELEIDSLLAAKASAADLSGHIGNSTVHITAAERTKWNGMTPTSRKVIAGTGLTGGGALTSDVTLSLATSGVTAGTYAKVTVDVYGRVTKGASLAASDIPNLPWSKITSGKPTTLAGYGITDGVNEVGMSGTGNAVTSASISGHKLTLTKGSTFLLKSTFDSFKSVFDSMFERVNIGTSAAPVYAIRAKMGLYSDDFVSARGQDGSAGAGGSGGGLFGLNSTWGAVTNQNSTDAFSDYAVWNGVNTIRAALDDRITNNTNAIVSQGNAITTLQNAGYATQSWVSANFNKYVLTKAAVEAVLTGNISSHTHSQYLTAQTFKYQVGGGYVNVRFTAAAANQAAHDKYIEWWDTSASWFAHKALKFIVNGGTSSQFLKADGSVDGNTYLTTGAAASTYVKLTGDQDISGTKFFTTKARTNVCFSAGEDVYDDAYGYFNVTRKKGSTKAACFSMVEQDTIPYAIGIDKNPNSIIFGSARGSSETQHKFMSVWARVSATGLAAPTFISTATTGTAPLTVASTTLVTNLNADMLDSKHVGNIVGRIPIWTDFPAHTDLKRDGYLPTTYDPNSSTASEEYFKALLKWATANYSGTNILLMGKATPSSHGLLHLVIYSTTLVQNGLPQHSYAVFHGYGGAVLCFGTKEYVWKWSNAAYYGALKGNADTATKLATPRKIWGNDFDGSGDVNGGLTFATLSGTNGRSLLFQPVADNDYFRLYVGATATNASYVEIATADDGTEPIYVRQYKGNFTIIQRTLALLDGSGNTQIPGLLTASGGVTIPSGKTLKIGSITLEEVNGALHVNKGVYSDDFISSRGADSASSGGGSLFGLYSKWEQTPSDTDALAAPLGKDLHNRVTALEGKNYLDALNVTTNGSGNAVTAVALSADKKLITVTKGTTFLTAHQVVSNKAATLAWNAATTIATIGTTNITVKLPANPNTDTKNTAGSTNTSSKIYLIGATSQAASPQTYSHDTAYVGTDGCLYSGGAKVLTAHQSLANYVTTDTAQEIRGAKTFSSSVVIDNASLIIRHPATTGGTAKTVYFQDSDKSTTFAFGSYLENHSLQHAYIGWSDTPWAEANCLAVSASKLKYKTNDILHAGNYAGILDSRYYTEAEVTAKLATKVSKSGDTMTGALTIKTGADNKLIFNNTDGEKASYLSFREADTEYSSIQAWEDRFQFSKYVKAPRFVSTVATGTAPFWVESTSLVYNLNADLLDGVHNGALTANKINANGTPQGDHALTWFSGQATIGTASGNAYRGSSTSQALWSFPNGGTAADSAAGGVANIMNLRLGWSSSYWADIFTSPNFDRLWYRRVYQEDNGNKVGGAWKQIAFTSDNVASANKLNVASTFSAWGKPYFLNGVPVNVSGDMSEVGSISMNGGISGATSIYASGRLGGDNIKFNTRMIMQPSAARVNTAGGGSTAYGGGFLIDIKNPVMNGAVTESGVGHEIYASDIGIHTSYNDSVRNWTPIIFLDKANMVGINKSYPSYPLDVAGTARVTKLIIGSVTLEEVGGALHINKGVYSDDFISARGADAAQIAALEARVAELEAQMASL